MNKKINTALVIAVTIIIAGTFGAIFWHYTSNKIQIKPTIACYDSLIKIADVKSLVIFDNSGYAKDDNNVYFPRDVICAINCYCRKFIISGADPETFSILSHGYAKDKNAIYFKGEKVNGVDLNSFEVVLSPDSFSAAKDKNNVYIQNTKINDADPDTFEYLDERDIYIYMKDKNHVWTMLREEPNSIQLIKGADPGTFKLIPTPAGPNISSNQHYALDKNHAYFQNKIIEDADPKTFQPLSIFISKDKNNAYAAENKIAGVDITTFEVIDSHYSKDKNHVYYLKNIVEGADPKTFNPKN